MINKWKVVAIVFMILFIVENLLMIFGLYLINKETNQTMECYYEICKDYPDAWLGEDNVCTCYDYDMFGEYVVAKEVWLK